MIEDQHTILLIEHNPTDARLIQAMLDKAEKTHFNLLCVNRLAGGKNILPWEESTLSFWISRPREVMIWTPLAN
jgi:hypothetical protein